MEFKYTEDQIALRRAVREWAQSYLAPKAEEIDVNNRFPTETIEALGEQDLMGLAYPEELGGAGYDAISEAIAMEEISAACAATGSIITGHYLGFDALYLAGTPEQKEKWLRPALEGEKYAAFCLTEPAGGSDMTSNKTTAVEDGDDYVINGVKHFITGGAHCDFLCCFAITNKEDPRHGMTCFVVEKGTPGMKIASEDNKMGIRGARTAEIVFEDCRVPKANMVGVPRLGPQEQGLGLLVFQHLQFGGVHPAYLYLVLHKTKPPACDTVLPVSPGRGLLSAQRGAKYFTVGQISMDFSAPPNVPPPAATRRTKRPGRTHRTRPGGPR